MSILITIRTKIILCRLPSLRSYLKSGKTLKNMKKITLFIMDVGVLDQRFSLSGFDGLVKAKRGFFPMLCPWTNVP